MAASIEPIGTRIYRKACEAISFVSLLTVAEDLHPELCAVGCLVAPTVVLFAKVCSCACDSIPIVKWLALACVVLHADGVGRAAWRTHWWQC